jgi:nucleotide-binding universal stress UspA family protein
MFRKLIAGVDGGPSGRDALALAAVLGHSPNADVLAIGVYPDPLMPFPVVFARHATMHEDCERELRAAREELAPRARIHAVPSVSPSRALWHAVEHEHADILVLGSARGTPDGEVRAGHHVRQILHDAACAVAIAPAGFAAHPNEIRQILVGFDGSAESHEALELGRALARVTGGSLRVLTAIEVIPPSATQLDPMGVSAADWDAVVDARRTHAREALDDAVAPDQGIETGIIEGEAGELLCEASSATDMLMIGSRHWGPIARIVLGGTGEYVVRHAHCPVLLVPRAAAHDTRPDHVSAHAGVAS